MAQEGWNGGSLARYSDLLFPAFGLSENVAQSNNHQSQVQQTTLLMAQAYFGRRLLTVDPDSIRLTAELTARMEEALKYTSDWEKMLRIMAIFAETGEVVRTTVELGAKWMSSDEFKTVSQVRPKASPACTLR